MRIGIRFVILGLAVAILAVVIPKYVRLGSSRSFNQIDSLSMELGHWHGDLAGTKVIGFKTNVPDDRVTELYFKSAFALAPLVLSHGDHDTTLILEHPAFPLINEPVTEVIKAGHIGSLSYKLTR